MILYNRLFFLFFLVYEHSPTKSPETKDLVSYTHGNTFVTGKHSSSQGHVNWPSSFVKQESVQDDTFILATSLIPLWNLLRSMVADRPVWPSSLQVQPRVVPEREQPLQVDE